MRRRAFLMIQSTQSLADRITAWQSSTLVHIGGVQQSLFNVAGGGGIAADFTILCPGYAVFQHSTVRQIVVNVVALSGTTPWKFKLFRWNGTTYAFVSECTFLPTGTGIQTVTLSTPLACQPGDIPGYYCPASNQIYGSSTGSRSLKYRYVAGDVTSDNAFASVSATSGNVNLELFGYRPYLALLGNSILEGSGNGDTQIWAGLYDTSLPAYIKTTPGGTASSEPGSILRAGVGDGTVLQYQNLGLGSTDWARTAATGAALAAAVKPYLTILHNGSNDANDRTWADISADMSTSLGVLQAAGSKVAVCEILPRTAYDDTDAALIRTMNANYATWCTANGVPLIACHDAMGQTRVSTGELDDYATGYGKADGLHLTTAGVTKLASLMLPYL